MPHPQADRIRYAPPMAGHLSPFENLERSRPHRTAKRIKTLAALGSLSMESSMSKNLDEVLCGEHWVLIGRVIEHTGYSDDAIRAKKRRGEWTEGLHWRKAPDNRVVFNLVMIQAWMGGHHHG